MIFTLHPVSGHINDAARHAVNIAKNNPEHGFILVFNGTHMSVEDSPEKIVENYNAQRS